MESQSGAMAAAPRLRLLLVEDEPIQRRFLERRLAKAGYEVDTASNGEEALAQMMAAPVHIVITDWDMPGMDGAALCRQIRAQRLTGYVYILLLTGHQSADDIVVGLEAGADDYIKKPANEAELLARLRTARRIVELERTLREANAQVQLLSITDPLLGIYNRRYLNEELIRETERAHRYHRPLCAVMADLDHFKAINDEYGHITGDEVLQGFVNRVRASLRLTDWVARYGGEEFAIILPETDLVDAVVVAEKIRALCEATPIPTSAGQVKMSASFGVAALGISELGQAESAASLLREADNELYQSKKTGRNRVSAARAIQKVESNARCGSI